MRIREKLSDSGIFYYIALMVMLQESQDSILPEVCHILDSHQILALISMFEGERVRIPTREELAMSLKTSLAIYYTKHIGLTLLETKKKLRLSDSEMSRIESRITKFCKTLREDTGLSIEELFNV